jgi:hypothetical protein
MKFPDRSSVKQVLLFALLGPPIAALFWQVWVGLAAEFPRQYTVGSWLSTWAGLSVFAYLWGFLPAFLTGVAAAYLRIAARSYSAPARIARVASTMAIGGFASWTVPRVYPGESDLTLAALGAAAALVCACWTEWRVRPNNSFKPNPLRGSA